MPPKRLAALDRVARALDWSPIALGSANEGRGLRPGGKPVDGAKVRNLFPGSDGDIDCYFAALVETGRSLGLDGAP